MSFSRGTKCCDLTSPNLDAMLSSLEGKGILIKGEWAKGKTRIFMRTAQSAQLEAHRESALSSVARVVQKWVRRFIRKAKYAQWLAIIRSLKAAVSARDEDELEKVYGPECGTPLWWSFDANHQGG